jgi:hypothetical protein
MVQKAKSFIYLYRGSTIFSTLFKATCGLPDDYPMDIPVYKLVSTVNESPMHCTVHLPRFMAWE